MSTVFQITAEGLFYSSRTRRVEVADAIRLLCRLLKGRTKFATFNALNQGILADWSLKDDAVIPFGDKRSTQSVTYTFDLDADTLRILESSRGLEISIDCFRHQSLVAIDNFTPFKLPLTTAINPQAFPTPHWTPDNQVSLRTATLFCRKFSAPFLSIATLDFGVVEEASRWLHTSQTGKSGRDPFVGIYDLPPWESFQNSWSQLGRIAVVLDEDLEHALENVRKLVVSLKQEGAKLVLSNTYLLFSGRDVVLCRGDSPGKLEHTAPASLLNGIDGPPLFAIELLLQALAFAYPPLPRTWLQKLPVELQDRILELVSEGPIEAARLGCLLEIGSPFTWVRMDKTKRGGAIERYESVTHRSPTTPVDSYIWVAGTFCGLAYR